MSALERLGWDSFFEQQRQRLSTEHQNVGHHFSGADRGVHGAEHGAVARVVEEQRGLYHVAGEFDGFAEVSGRYRHRASAAADFPTVGDWVVLRGSNADRAVIEWRFDRRSVISRAAAGRAIDEQVLCANVDTIFLVTALVGDLNARRLERYLTMVWDAGAVPVVVLNKADACEDPEGAADEMRARLAGVDVAVVSAVREEGLDALASYLQPARTVALLGSSGVGKSTIVNRLLGRDVQPVAAIRETDGRGRHTTTARSLVELPGGALLIDTPGMRELQIWGDEETVSGAFEDIASLAAECRFSDCAHEGEPGCAVRDAADAGRLDPDRLENFRRLVREAAFEERKADKGVAAEHKRHWKQLHKAAKAMYRERGR